MTQQTDRPEKPALKKKERENSGARTHDIQSHNLALYH